MRGERVLRRESAGRAARSTSAAENFRCPPRLFTVGALLERVVYPLWMTMEPPVIVVDGPGSLLPASISLS